MDILKVSPFKQKMIESFPLDCEIKSVSIKSENEIYACTDKGLKRLKDGVWQDYCDDKLYSLVYCDGNGRVLGAFENKVYTITDKGAELLFEFISQVTDIKFDEKLYVLTATHVYIETEDEDKFFNLGGLEQEGLHLAVGGGRLCVADSRCIQRMEGKRRTWRCIFPDHSTMPKINIQCIAFDKNGYLLVGAKEGLFIYDYRSGWYSKELISALPEESVLSICVCDDGSFLLGTDAGAIIIRNGMKKYLPATRYAYDTDVTGVTYYNDSLYTVSKGGIKRIYEQEMTLEDKAWHLFRETEKYFPRKEGYVTWISKFDGTDTSHITDNDGLWTQCYIGALAMCYSLTKNEEALKAARRSMNAMLFLTRAPEIKGFTARAVRYPDEANWGKGIDKTGVIGQEWHRSSDGTYEWLGETSSDEMTGHYFGFCLYYDLCATEEEKAEIRDAVCAITDHILENDGYLIDCDGKPTSWACWNETALNTDSMWTWEKGVNSLEMLNFLKVSYHMSGDEKYQKRYEELIKEHHFLINAAFHKRADGHTCHIDDNLAMLNAMCILRLEKDPAIRQYLLMGLASHFDYERIEDNPYYAFIYRAFTQAPCDMDSCVKHLQDYPYDIKNCRMINSKRKDYEMTDESVYWIGTQQLKKPFGWDERPWNKLGINPFGIDGGNPDRSDNGMSYIFIYWLGRFLGLIE